MLSTFKALILDDHALCCEHTRSLLMEAGGVPTPYVECSGEGFLLIEPPSEEGSLAPGPTAMPLAPAAAPAEGTPEAGFDGKGPLP